MKEGSFSVGADHKTLAGWASQQSGCQRRGKTSTFELPFLIEGTFFPKPTPNEVTPNDTLTSAEKHPGDRRGGITQTLFPKDASARVHGREGWQGKTGGRK